MANPAINFAGFLYDDAGDAISGATINLYDKNTSTTSRASTTTDSNGAWSIAHTTAGEFDVQITSGSSKRRIKFDDKVHLSELDAEVLNVRGNEGAAAPLYFFSDEGDDAGDRWLFNAAAGGVFTMGNDINTQGTYVAHVTITPNSTVASSTFAIAGGATVGGSLTLSTVAAAGTDTDKFLVLDGSGNVDYRTGTQVASDIGAITSGVSLSGSTDNTVVTVTGSNATQGEANLTFDGSTLAVTGDLTVSGGDGALQFTNAGENSIKIPDNQASALIIEEANNAYMTFVSSNSSEKITFAKALDIDADVQIDAAVTVGVNDTGHDVKFFGASSGAYFIYDQSEDQVEIRGAAADATTSTGKLLLTTALTDINANDVIGKVSFQAPLEAGGTDAITIAASIEAVAQGTFSASVNATDIIFKTGHSEAATEKFRFTSQGEIGIGGTNYGSSGQILTSGGTGSAASWSTIAAGGSATFTADGTIATGAMVTSSSTAGRVKQATTGHGTWSHITHKLAVAANAEPFIGKETSIIYCDDSSTAANNRVAVAYKDNAGSNYLVIQIGQYIAADEQVVWGPRTILNSAASEQVTAVWDGVRDRIVIVYVDGSSGDLFSTVCTINTSTSGQSSAIHTSGDYAPDTADVAVDVSGLSLSPVVRLAAVANCDDTDGNTGHILVTFDTSTRMRAIVGVASGTYFNGMTWGAVQTVDDTHNHFNDSLAWDTNIDRGISTYYGSSATDLHYRVIEIENDDTISVGAEGTIGTSATPLGVNSKTSVVFDDDTNNVVVVYMQSDRHYLIAGTLATGITASWGTAVSLDVWFGAKPTFRGNEGYLMTVDTDSNQIVLVGAVGGAYGTDGQPSMAQLDGRLAMSPATVRSFGVYLASLSGTTVTVVNAEPMLVAGQNIKQTWVQPQQMTARQNAPEYRVRSITYDTVAKRIYTTWAIEWQGGLGASGYADTQWIGVCKVIKAPYTPPSWIGDTGFVGFATTGVSDGASVTVTVAGGINENQSSLTAGQRYVIFDDGILRKPSDLVNKDLISSASRTGSLYDIKQTKSSFSIWRHEVGVATDTDKLFINFHGGLE